MKPAAIFGTNPDLREQHTWVTLWSVWLVTNNDATKQDRLRRLTRELSLARARERKQIARELHDSIGQSLAFIRMKLVSLQGDAVFSGFDKNIDEILGMLDQTIRHTRGLSFEISPPVLHELGLIHALEWLAERFQQKHSLQVKVIEKHRFPEFDETINGQLFFSVRELLINVVKHANARKAQIILDVWDGIPIIEVVDNGIGFDVARAMESPDEDHGIGLFNIREQLEYAGGRLVCTSSPSAETRIRLELPGQD